MRVFMLCGKRRIFCFALAAALILLLLLSRPLGLLPVSSTDRLVPIYEVQTDQAAVSLSFDATWGAEYTGTILDTLDRYQVSATFFLVNIWIEEFPELTEEIAKRGHEIGLHSADHLDFTSLSEGEIKKELTDNFQLILDVSGYQAELFRPPFGAYNNTVVRTVNACGYDCIQWSIDSWDWMDLSAEEIYNRVTKDIHAGDIVLFHNNGLHTAEALPQILDYLQSQGLAVVPVCELLLDGDCYVDRNGIQRQGT